MPAVHGRQVHRQSAGLTVRTAPFEQVGTDHTVQVCDGRNDLVGVQGMGQVRQGRLLPVSRHFATQQVPAANPVHKTVAAKDALLTKREERARKVSGQSLLDVPPVPTMRYQLCMKRLRFACRVVRTA